MNRVICNERTKNWKKSTMSMGFKVIIFIIRFCNLSKSWSFIISNFQNYHFWTSAISTFGKIAEALISNFSIFNSFDLNFIYFLILKSQNFLLGLHNFPFWQRDQLPRTYVCTPLAVARGRNRTSSSIYPGFYPR